MIWNLQLKGWLLNQRWKSGLGDSDKELNTTIWLGYEMKDRDHVACLKCTVCSMFRDQLVGMRNYSNAFIEGSVNLHSSNYQDHSKIAMHEKAMTLFKLKQSGTDKPSTIHNTPIVRALQTLDQKTCDQMMKNC